MRGHKRRLRLLAGKVATREILDALADTGKAHCTDLLALASVPIVCQRLRELEKFRLIQHHITKQGKREEWYTITEAGKEFAGKLHDMDRLEESLPEMTRDSIQGGGSMKEFNNVYQFEVTLDRSNPPIWRRIQVPETYTFWDLHVAIQDAMGWEHDHLHEFEVTDPSTGSKVCIGAPRTEIRERILQEESQNISNYFSMENKPAQYVYDFGDTWEHAITLEKILPRQGGEYPRCTGGARACPPEDCGGMRGYEDLLEILKIEDHERHEEVVEWVGEGFDPERFDAGDVHFTDPEKLRSAFR